MSADRIDQLEAEVAELRQLVEALTNGTAELVVRRLAVVDDNGVERVATNVTTSYAELRVDGTGRHHAQAAVVLAVEDPKPGDGRDFTNADVFISGGGDIVTRMTALQQRDGWDAWLLLDDQHGSADLTSRSLAEATAEEES
jgi:hypothetical protein